MQQQGPHLTLAVQEADFDPALLQRELQAADGDSGAIVTFTGCVRGRSEQGAIAAMTLEHYPGMTEAAIHRIMDEASTRWNLHAATVVHRIGRLGPGAQIVWVGVSARHRGAAFAACDFIMDYLKTRAPFWKKESGPEGEHWVEARQADLDRARRWQAQQ